MKYWITVVSKDHITRGVAGGFMQANHGKQGPLTRMATGDWVIIYSPKKSMEGDEKLQAFTAIGQVAADEIYQYKMSEDFKPFRRDVTYYQCKETPIVPLVDKLSFMPNKQSWGYPFRFGFFELPGHDFELIKNQMLTNEPTPINNK
jgi:hypothetical protein